MSKPNPSINAVREMLDDIEATPGANELLTIQMTRLEWHTIASFLDPEGERLSPLAYAILNAARLRFYKQLDLSRQPSAASHLN